MAIIDTAVHDIDVTRWLVGEEIVATRVLKPRRNGRGLGAGPAGLLRAPHWSRSKNLTIAVRRSSSGLGQAALAVPDFRLEREHPGRQGGFAVLAAAVAAIGEASKRVFGVG